MRLDDRGERPIGGRVARAARIDPFEPVVERFDRARPAVAPVDRVVGKPAESVERQRRIADAARQQKRRGVERPRALPDRRAACREVVRRDQATRPATAAGTASGTSFPSTSAEAITPGSPAPGWVPAPTR